MKNILLIFFAAVLLIFAVSCDVVDGKLPSEVTDTEIVGRTLAEIENEYGPAAIYQDEYIEYWKKDGTGNRVTRIYFGSDGVAVSVETDYTNFDGNDTSDTEIADLPDDFDICYRSWIGSDKNVYDTYSDTLTKDLAPGSASAELEPDAQTLGEIYRMLVLCDIASIDLEMTSEVLTTDPELLMMMMEPLTHYEITFTANGETYTVIGDATAQGYIKTDADASNFVTFCQFMSNLMNDAFDEAELPPILGGYE